MKANARQSESETYPTVPELCREHKRLRKRLRAIERSKKPKEEVYEELRGEAGQFLGMCQRVLERGTTQQGKPFSERTVKTLRNIIGDWLAELSSDRQVQLAVGKRSGQWTWKLRRVFYSSQDMANLSDKSAEVSIGSRPKGIQFHESLGDFYEEADLAVIVRKPEQRLPQHIKNQLEESWQGQEQM